VKRIAPVTPEREPKHSEWSADIRLGARRFVPKAGFGARTSDTRVTRQSKSGHHRQRVLFCLTRALYRNLPHAGIDDPIEIVHNDHLGKTNDNHVC
jgi:hypothetical protein